MTQLSPLFKLIAIGLLLGLFLHLGPATAVSWATGDGETQRQTVPTRTVTPRPVTPTSPPPARTPRPSTNTPAPPTQETATPSLSPTAETPLSEPSVLPAAGNRSWSWMAAALLTIGGMLALLTGLEARQSRR